MLLRLIVGIVVGGLAGFGLYRFVGCSTGTCPLMANPWISTIWGMILGGLFAYGRG